MYHLWILWTTLLNGCLLESISNSELEKGKLEEKQERRKHSLLVYSRLCSQSWIKSRDIQHSRAFFTFSHFHVTFPTEVVPSLTKQKLLLIFVPFQSNLLQLIPPVFPCPFRNLFSIKMINSQYRFWRKVQSIFFNHFNHFKEQNKLLQIHHLHTSNFILKVCSHYVIFRKTKIVRT